MGVFSHAKQSLLHRRTHALFIDITHVKDFQARLMHQTFFTRIHTANTDLTHHVCRNCGCMPTNLREDVRANAAQHRHRHPVDIACWREFIGIKIRVRVQPQHAQIFARLTTMARRRAD